MTAAAHGAGASSTAAPPASRRQIASASTVPASVSTVLVPTKKAASCAAGTALPVTGPNVAASIATPAPTEAGAKGRSAPLPWANITSSTRDERRREAEGGEEARERRERGRRGSPLPRQHARA